MKLCINARDAMPNGGSLIIGAVEKSVAKSEMEDLCAGQYICLFVKDSGEGMDEETLSKAGTPFFTTKGVGKGSGLGLSMVQGLLSSELVGV